MIFVDTSIWVSFLRGSDQEIVAHLRALLDADRVALPAPVRLELLSGARKDTWARLNRALSGLPVFYPAKDTWALVEGWVERAVGLGQRFGVGDLLIAATAAERGGRIWSADEDFRRMAKLGFVKLHRTR